MNLSETIFKLYSQYHDAMTMSDYKNCLSEIKSEEEKPNINSEDHVNLLHLECITRQRIYETGPCPIEKIIPNLNKALECCIEIQIFCENDEELNLMSLVSMQEETCILTELNRFNENNDYLIEAVDIQEHIRNDKNADEQLIYLSYMNEAKIRNELANNNINPEENYKLSLKLSEKAREHYNIEFSNYSITFQNQIDALLSLCKLEHYGFEIEMKETFKRLNNHIDKEISLFNLQIDSELVELGIKDPRELDEILENLPLARLKLYPEENLYKQSIIFEGKILIKKAKFSTDNLDKITYLNQSIEYFNKHLEFDDKYYTMQSIFNLGHAKLKLSELLHKEKNLNDAFEYFLICLEYYEDTPLQNNEYFYPLTALYLSKTGKQLALLENKLNEKYETIYNTLNICLKFFEENNDKEKLIDAYLELGDLFFNISNYEKAYYYLDKGIDLVEIMRSSILDLNIKKKFFKKSNRLFKLMIETCYHLNKPDETLKFIELSKHRSFIDKISENQKYDLNKPIDKELIYELHNINSKIESLIEKLKNCDKYQYKISGNYERLSKLIKQQNYFLFKIKTDFSDFYDYYYNQFFDYTKLDLKNKTLIEYYYNEDILLICLIENGKLIIKDSNLKNTKLLEYIEKFKENIEKSMYDEKYEQSLDRITKIMEQLYNILIRPVKSEISNNDLLIIPYKELHNIPFYCLKNKNIHMIDNYTLTIAQSGSSIKYIENNALKSNNDSLVLAMQDEKLTHTIDEIKYISEKLDTTPLINEEITKENVLNSIEGKTIIHYAGHGYFNSKNPLKSHLKLYDGDLFIKDIENKNINSELIVLSACETGIVSSDENDETVSFITSLQLDGVKYIIASLWPVFDDSTMKLFKYFYSSNEEYSKRLRFAQLELKKENHDLLHWGGFQIYGI